MKVNQKFVIRKIMEDNILIPVGQNTSSFNGMITMNDIGVFIWENLDNVENEEDLLNKLLDEYDIDKETAKLDMEEFLQVLRKSEII